MSEILLAQVNRGCKMDDVSHDGKWFCDNIEQNKLDFFRFAKSILRNDDDAMDAVSEAILKAYVNLGKLRDREKFKAWMMRILANEAYKICNKRKRAISIEELGEIAAIDSDSESLVLWSAIESLSKDLRAAVVLFYYDDFSIKEISKVLGISQGAIKTRLSRAREKLRSILSDEEDL